VDHSEEERMKRSQVPLWYHDEEDISVVHTTTPEESSKLAQKENNNKLPRATVSKS
jgi:hypothetical protein